MKKSLLALAVFGAFAGVASAQSSVTMYGLIDANLGKDIGSTNKRMAQGASSRLGFRGVEDLGGGSAAFFQLENRYTPNNGVINGGAGGTNGTPVTFWQARSYVGLRGGWGEVRLGREYNGAFFHGEVMGDPWGWDTVASTLTVNAMRSAAPTFTNVNSAVTYNSPNMSGFSFTGQVAAANGNCGAPVLASGGVTFGSCAKRPMSGGASYAAGPFAVRLGYVAPGSSGQKWTSFNTQYDLGVAKLWGFLGSGTAADGVTGHKSWMLGVNMPMGQADLRFAIVDRKQTSAAGATIDSTAGAGNNARIQGYAVGYHYALSKRTTLYTDIARNSKAAVEKVGYDFGVKHAF